MPEHSSRIRQEEKSESIQATRQSSSTGFIKKIRVASEELDGMMERMS
jgi:hypothetical protein